MIHVQHNCGADGLAVCPVSKKAPAALEDGKTVRPTKAAISLIEAGTSQT